MKNDDFFEIAAYESPEGNTLRCGEIPVHSLMFITSQLENDRACLAAQALNNTAMLKDMAKRFAGEDPWDKRYYDLIVSAYGGAVCETIFEYGRDITTNKGW